MKNREIRYFLVRILGVGRDTSFGGKQHESYLPVRARRVPSGRRRSLWGTVTSCTESMGAFVEVLTPK